MKCDFPDCGRQVVCRSLCQSHYKQWRRNEPLKPLRYQVPVSLDLKSRLLKGIKVNPATDCWEWQGCKATVQDKGVPAGYGRMTYKGFTDGTHRISYQVHIGPIPPDRIVCHSCDNRPCCNPWHLFLGTDESNADDKSAKGRHPRNAVNHCMRGHEYTPDNLIWFLTENGKPARACRQCRREYVKRRKQRMSDPAVREKRNALARSKSKTPEYREKHAARARRYNAAKRANRK